MKFHLLQETVNTLLVMVGQTIEAKIKRMTKMKKMKITVNSLSQLTGVTVNEKAKEKMVKTRAKARQQRMFRGKGLDAGAH